MPATISARSAALTVALASATVLGALALPPVATAAPAPAGTASTATQDVERPQGKVGPLKADSPLSDFSSSPAATAAPITRSAVIARAKTWADAKVPYSMNDYRGGYRTDCSGLVSMAWNLGTNAWTGNLDTYATRISKSDLKKGDMLLFHNPSNPTSGSHVVLFERWANSSHTSYVGIEQTPPHAVRRTIPYAYFNNSGSYVPYRYKNIVEDVTATRDHDYTGDLKDDLLGVDSTGTLRLYSGNGTSGVNFTREIGGGWDGMDKVAAADFNGDGDGDLVATKRTTGELFLYIGDGDGGFKSTNEIGHGWTGIEQLAAGDFTGDGKADIVAVNKTDATLNLYTGNGNGVAHTKQIGSGWSKMTNLAAGDFNGDNRADLIATREDTGTLLLYPGTSGGNIGNGIEIGSSFHLMSHLTLTDINSDGRADVVATNRNTGDLHLYTSKSNSLNSGTDIGHGWNTFKHLI
ncbi:FG-GAP-like repeat-containing protein [Streptomyces sp. NPDC017556]|uniref:C40 family peptidase n=2 Tax=unclassified Streptomyces TaxID=2593676 RepID=UPI003788BFE9